MACYTSCLLCSLVLTVISEICHGFKNSAPVLLWDPSSSGQNEGILSSIPFKTSLDDSDFMVNVVPTLKERENIVVFMLHHLNTEDFKRKLGEQNISFKNLENTLRNSSSVYLPSVKNPGKVFHNLGLSHRFTHIHNKPSENILNAVRKFDFTDENYLLISIPENEPNLDLNEATRNSDQLIKEIQDIVFSHVDPSKTLFLLTGKVPNEKSKHMRISRTLLATVPNEENVQETIISSECCLLYYTNVTFGLSNGNNSLYNGPLPLQVQQNVSCGATEAQLSLTYNVTSTFMLTVSFKFVGTNKTGWALLQMNYDMSGTLNNENVPSTSISTPISNIGVPSGMSYHCTSGANFPFRQKKEEGSLKGFIKFLDFQVQPFVSKKFDYPYDCVGFFSIPVLEALIVTFVLGIILAWGVLMLSNIKTMDQFDVPNSKPIVTAES